MTDLHARLVAAIQQVRTTTPRECLLGCMPNVHSPWCDERWAARVDARLAACVEAAIECAYLSGDDSPPSAHHRAVAAFLAAAAQKETTK